MQIAQSPQPKCRHVHISEQTKTDGTPYVKGWCEKCKAWVYSEKRYCICCRSYVTHKSHHLRLKKILNKAMMEQYDAIEDFKWMPHRTITYIEVRFDKKIYHFPLKFLVLYQVHEHPKEILPLIQDSIRIMKEK